VILLNEFRYRPPKASARRGTECNGQRQHDRASSTCTKFQTAALFSFRHSSHHPANSIYAQETQQVSAFDNTAMLMCCARQEVNPALYQYLSTECLRFPKQLFSSRCSFLFLSFSSYLSFFLLFIFFCISRNGQYCLRFHLSFHLSFRRTVRSKLKYTFKDPSVLCVL
jgi:hypothetical protein